MSTKAKTTKTDTKFAEMNENKIEKATRNSAALDAAFKRAKSFEYDEDISSATNLPYLKVTERFTIHKIFDLAKGEDVYKMYKEVFYINDPGKHYYDTVDEDKVYRRIAAQKEKGDKKWAHAVAKKMGIEIVDEGDSTTPTADPSDANADA